MRNKMENNSNDSNKYGLSNPDYKNMIKKSKQLQESIMTFLSDPQYNKKIQSNKK